MNRFLRVFLERGKNREYVACIVAYADDFVILSKGKAKAALGWTRPVMVKLGLSLNETKTCIRHAWREHFDFLGYTFGPERNRSTGHLYLAATPSKKSVQRLKEKIRLVLRPGNMSPRDEVIGDLNRLLKGWGNYFSYGSTHKTNRAVENYVYDTVRGFLRRRHKVPTRGAYRFNDRMIFGALGVMRLYQRRTVNPTVSLT